ncbi:hypothetical protein [Acidithiobacillus ferrivorans]|uniref:hypothetical protein n=1 Tax=Acidithiobacillus ferrivorans TaxID=160808 RepID=UPI001681871C|nr:hypothetical protein [Acidithiobacillus ferrivorans]
MNTSSLILRARADARQFQDINPHIARRLERLALRLENIIVEQRRLQRSHHAN